MTVEASPYTSGFFGTWAAGSSNSAATILSIVLDRFEVTSAIDVGCGVGTWTAVMQERLPEVVSVDGEWVPAESRRPGFLARDLEQPLRLGRTFDLAVSVEVAEHLSPARGPQFVADLCRLAPVILFSAAIPFQGGTHHVNERWQSYWAQLFSQHGFWAHDIVRPVVWDDPQVESWYSQNVLVYTRSEPDQRARLDQVHPRTYLQAIKNQSPGARRELRVNRWVYPWLRPIVRAVRPPPS